MLPNERGLSVLRTKSSPRIALFAQEEVDGGLALETFDVGGLFGGGAADAAAGAFELAGVLFVTTVAGVGLLVASGGGESTTAGSDGGFAEEVVSEHVGCALDESACAEHW